MAENRLEEILNFVESMGKPDQIAEYMRKQGITGRPMRSDSCVMARYVELQYEPRDLERIIAYPIIGFYLQHAPDGRVEEAKTPDNVAEFMAAFDGLKYPDLIEKVGPA